MIHCHQLQLQSAGIDAITHGPIASVRLPAPKHKLAPCAVASPLVHMGRFCLPLPLNIGVAMSSHSAPSLLLSLVYAAASTVLALLSLGPQRVLAEDRVIYGREAIEKIRLCQAMQEQNASNLKTWSGEMSMTSSLYPYLIESDTNTASASPAFKNRKSRICFNADLVNDRVATTYEVEGGVPGAPYESRFSIGPDEFLAAPAILRSGRIADFPEFPSLINGVTVVIDDVSQGRSQMVYGDIVNPLLAFGRTGGSRSYWNYMDLIAKHLEKETSGFWVAVEESEAGEMITAFRGDSSGNPADAVSVWRMAESAGYNVVEHVTRMPGRDHVTSSRVDFTRTRDIWLPSRLTQCVVDGSEVIVNRQITFVSNVPNPPLTDDSFGLEFLGVSNEGDRVWDKLQNALQIFDGERLVPADSYYRRRATSSGQ